VAIRAADAEHADVAHVETGPGLNHLCFRARSREDVDRVHEYSLSFRDPEGIRLELNHVPRPGLLVEGASFNPAPDHPIEGRPRAGE
jgi:hypothetical protein